MAFAGITAFLNLTATAGGFDLERDVRTGHGPLGQLYPTNTNMRQKEGDTMMFLYLLPTGMNDPISQPGEAGPGATGRTTNIPASPITGPTNRTPGRARPAATTHLPAGPPICKTTFARAWIGASPIRLPRPITARSRS